ncbi:hypothetical protein GCM10027167_65990 [Nocardia heshunensis]
MSDSDIPPTAPERSALLRSLLADRRILLVLDNAGTLDQVTPLLPSGPGCAVVITSRALLPLPDATYRHLDVLSAGEARNLLGRIIGTHRIAAEPDATEAVIAACGRLPLALRIIGARLTARPHWSIAAVAARLSDERHRLTELRCGDLTVDACFTFGYRDLPAATAKAFVALAVPAVPDLSVASAAAILNVDAAAATELCESLVDLGLLQSLGPDRYSYHDLLRLFAHTVAPDLDRDQLLARLLDHYLATAKNTIHQRYPGHRLDYVPPTTRPGAPIYSETGAHAWLDLERTSLIALHHQIAADHPALVPASVNVAMLISEGIDPSAQSGQLAHALRCLLSAAQRAGDQDTELRARTTLGLILALDLGRGDEALDLLHPARKALQAKGNSLLLGFVEHILGAAVLSLGREAEAITHMATAVDIFYALGDPAWEGWACATLADRYGDAARWDDAAATAERATRLADRLGGAAFDSLARCQVARVVLLRDNDFDRAAAMCADAVRVARAHGRRLLLGWALHRQAEINLHGRRFALAESAAAESVSVLTEAADPFRRTHALHCQAAALTALGRDEEARQVRAQLR